MKKRPHYLDAVKIRGKRMKKLNNFKGFTLGIVVCMLVTTLIVPALASSLTRTAQLVYDNIKITLNGSAVTPKDANGNTVEPFTIDGTTYLPVRAVGNALGLSVDWDGNTNTAILSSVQAAPFTLGTGQYVVGEDIAAGKYDCTATSGSGNFQGKVASLSYSSLNEILGTSGAYSPSYQNLRLAKGDTITIKGNLVIKFTVS